MSTAPSPRSSRASGEVRRVLVVKICCIGDVVLTTPLARALRAAWPRAEICYLTGAFSLEVARRVPWADRVIEFPERASVAARAAFLVAMRRERFDVGFCTHKRLPATLGLALTGCRIRVGYDYRGHGVPLTHRVPFDAHEHEVRRVLSLLGPLGVPDAGDTCSLRLLPGDAESADVLLRRAGVDPDRPLAAVFPGGGVNPGTTLAAKRWTVEGFRALSVFLRDRAGLQVAVIGGPGDEPRVHDVADGLGAGVAAVADGSPLGTMMGVLARCRTMAGGDSGLTHIAAALGVPTLALFGPTDPGQWAPLGPQHAHVTRALPCSPCFTADERLSATFRACRTWECLQALPADVVISAAETHLRRLGMFPCRKEP